MRRFFRQTRRIFQRQFGTYVCVRQVLAPVAKQGAKDENSEICRRDLKTLGEDAILSTVCFLIEKG